MAKFLFRNLKGYRWLVVIAIIVTFLAVGCEIVAAYPLKWIPSKVSNGGNDPSCNYQFLNPILDKFDIPLFDPSLQLDKSQPPVQPGITQCPISPGDPNPQLIISHHSTNGVIIFSVLTSLRCNVGALSIHAFQPVVTLLFQFQRQLFSAFLDNAAG